MIHYILQIIAYQLLFLVVYDMFLKKETFFTWNRCYLLITPILSFILPFIKIDAIRETIPASYTIVLPEVLLQTSITDTAINGGVLDEIVLTGTKPISLITWILGIWIVGMIITLAYFVYKVIKIQRLKRKGILNEVGDLHVVTLPNTDTAFSFFNTIFLGENLSDVQRDNIMLHETIHIKEHHSFDMLFFEVLRIVCWFNPLVYVYQNKMMLLQEYTADAKVVSQNGKKTYYQSLLSQVFNTENVSFINTFFNHSLIKKRISMLQKSKSKQISQLKYLVLIPLIFGILIYTSCSNDNSLETPTEVNIESLSYELVKGEDLEGENLKTHQAYEAFLIANPDYVGWTSINEEGTKLSYSVHKLSEGKPEGYFELTYNIGDKSYNVYMNLGTPKTPPTDDVTMIEEIVVNPENVDDIPFAVIDQVPVFPNCTGTNEERKVCMSQSIAKHVNREFDTSLGKTLGLTGVNKIFVAFKIDKNGDVVNVRVRAPHPDLEAEAKRVMKTLPQMQPGEQNGVPVGVLYSLPITFQIHS
ncbi:M56 family metallopeptidase [uncultured Dokdonia sp.]|uniref:M56 family metallopeptidase n=1 Tax=uncultured Dokdonia sp. TaxID=575653 RepID=UPI00261ABD80|nr:M56 family metallopeptidase [uncultured Dokdonia sp.]